MFINFNKKERGILNEKDIGVIANSFTINCKRL